MIYDQIVAAYIRDYRDAARAEMDQYRRLPSLRQAIHHAALCHRLPDRKRHPHQYRIPGAVLQAVERELQRAAPRLARSPTFEALQGAVAAHVGSMPGIGSLTVYDIAHRIGAYLGRPPRLVYLHRGTAEGARHLGFTGAILDPASLPGAFSRLMPAEIEDCLCIYKDRLNAILPRGGASRCVHPGRSRGCVVARPAFCR